MMKSIRRALGIVCLMLGVVFLVWTGYWLVVQPRMEVSWVVAALGWSFAMIYVGIMWLSEKDGKVITHGNGVAKR